MKQNIYMDKLRIAIDRISRCLPSRHTQWDNGYRTLFETVDTPSVIVDYSGLIIFANSSFERFSGFTRKEMEGLMVWQDFLAAEDRERSLKFLTSIREGLNPWKFDGYRFICRRGDVREIIVRDIPLTGTGQIILSHTDITRSIQAEDAMISASDLARSAGIMREEFLKNISHELRTPLNGISGSLQLLKETDMSDYQSSLTDAALAAATSLSGVLVNLIEYSHIESDRFVLNIQPFRLKDSLQSVIDVFQIRVKGKGITLTFDYDWRIPLYVNGDEDRIKRIFQNLLENAIKFTEQGQIHVQVLPEMDKDGLSAMILSIEDTGMGIPESRINELFQPFHQLDGSLTRRQGGSGLGLVLTKNMLTLMGGTIEVTSIPGKGSRFIVVLPLKEAADSCRKPDVVSETGPSAHGWSITKDMNNPPILKTEPHNNHVMDEKILVVEDEPISRRLIHRILKGMPCQVDDAENGLEALEKIKLNKYNLVFMDLQMPVMDGFEATRRIRLLDGEKSRVPIVALTANSLPEDRLEARRRGMDDFIAKPMDPSVIRQTVIRYSKGAHYPEKDNMQEGSPSATQPWR